MEDFLSPAERKLKRKGFLASMIFHAFVIILLLLPLLSIPIPPPGPPGVLVNLGLPDVGQGEENAPAAAPAKAEKSEPQEEPVPEPQKPEPQKQEPKKTAPPKVAPQESKPVVKTEDPEAVAIRQQKERERQEAIRRQQEEEERNRKAQEEVKKKAEAEARAQELKNQLKTGLGGGAGKGKGETGKPGNQGDPGGDPDSDKLKGKSTGFGGDAVGFGDRKPTSRPSIDDDFQQEGTIVLDVCVAADGSVISANYKLGGSTSSNSQLINIAKNNALRWRFERGTEERQCGTITYRFSLK